MNAVSENNPNSSANNGANNIANSADEKSFQREALRAKLLAAREVMLDRAERERVLANRVGRWLRTMPVTRLGFYWPIRGEPDITQTIAAWLQEDSKRSAGLPVVTGDTLEFAPWTPGTPMEVGVYGIPIPARVARMTPQLLLIPCVGFDANRYRLGYGSGYYDRTLASLTLKPVTVGVSFESGRVNSIGPQSHDVRMTIVITEEGAT